MDRNKLRSRICFLILGLVLTGAVEAEEKAGTKTQPGEVNLVWPPPPAQPRIRFIAEIRGREDIVGKKKRSFLDRMIGKPEEQDRYRFHKPYGVALGPAGNVYVADTAQKAIFVFHLEKRFFQLWGGSPQIPLAFPAGLALDPFDRLFVTDAFAHQVVVFQSGVPISAFGREELERPAGIAIDPHRNRVHVVDSKAHQVLTFDLVTFDLIRRVGRRSEPGNKEAGSFLGPTNIAVDASGRLFVSDTFNRRVQLFDPEGDFLHTFGAVGVQPGDFVRPKGIAIDRDGHVYVADAEFNNVQIFDDQGNPLLFFGSLGTGSGQFWLPTGVAIGGNNRIGVAEHGDRTGRVQIFEYVPRPEGAGAQGRKPEAKRLAGFEAGIP